MSCLYIYCCYILLLKNNQNAKISEYKPAVAAVTPISDLSETDDLEADDKTVEDKGANDKGSKKEAKKPQAWMPHSNPLRHINTSTK